MFFRPALKCTGVLRKFRIARLKVIVFLVDTTLRLSVCLPREDLIGLAASKVTKGTVLLQDFAFLTQKRVACRCFFQHCRLKLWFGPSAAMSSSAG